MGLAACSKGLLNKKSEPQYLPQSAYGPAYAPMPQGYSQGYAQGYAGEAPGAHPLPPYDLPPYQDTLSAHILSVPHTQHLPMQAGGDPHHNAGEPHPPEAKVYDASRNARADVLAGLTRARSLGKKTIIVMGANWCHDSRILAGRFAQPHFQTLLRPNYEVVYVDAGQKNRNLDIAQDFGVPTIEGTPTIFVVGPDGRWLNPQTATTWRNAGSRSDEAIYTEFAQLAQL